MIPLREVIAISLSSAVIVVLVLRVRTATRLMRRALVPVFSVALVRAATLILYFPIRRVDPDSAALDVLAWTTSSRCLGSHSHSSSASYARGSRQEAPCRGWPSAWRSTRSATS